MSVVSAARLVQKTGIKTHHFAPTPGMSSNPAWVFLPFCILVKSSPVFPPFLIPGKSTLGFPPYHIPGLIWANFVVAILINSIFPHLNIFSILVSFICNVKSSKVCSAYWVRLRVGFSKILVYINVWGSLRCGQWGWGGWRQFQMWSVRVRRGQALLKAAFRGVTFFFISEDFSSLQVPLYCTL